jgi:hypothetical protein
MYLGGKTRNKHDHIPSTIRREHGTKGRKHLFSKENEVLDDSELPMKELLDSTPSPTDLTFFGTFGQRLRFDFEY